MIALLSLIIAYFCENIVRKFETIIYYYIFIKDNRNFDYEYTFLFGKKSKPSW